MRDLLLCLRCRVSRGPGDDQAVLPVPEPVPHRLRPSLRQRQRHLRQRVPAREGLVRAPEAHQGQAARRLWSVAFFYFMLLVFFRVPVTKQNLQAILKKKMGWIRVGGWLSWIEDFELKSPPLSSQAFFNLTATWYRTS